jgi:preprotein translocase subunit YajC
MHHQIALVAQDQTGKDNAQGQPVGDWTLPFLMIAIVGAFFVIVILPARRREKKEREDLLSKMKKNDEVLTASGIIGIIAMIKDDEVVLKVDESSNVRIRVLKSAIARILNPKEPTKAGSDAQQPVEKGVKPP